MFLSGKKRLLSYINWRMLVKHENGVFNMPFSVAMVMDVSESRKMVSES